MRCYTFSRDDDVILFADAFFANVEVSTQLLWTITVAGALGGASRWRLWLNLFRGLLRKFDADTRTTEQLNAVQYMRSTITVDSTRRARCHTKTVFSPTIFLGPIENLPFVIRGIWALTIDPTRYK